ncbi:signal peptidase I [Blochmannia endosymbiont of Camponotus sp.]|uniref:signal peptidase I n=1 Tax=Blochmannia endosymbiont of Camponotus sp. TaxID=700220 RepID=UPI002024DD23|nr:signal peptidase I [Blochmannia endosymbiont of Camponotus sp.]URJ31235.1 signal peptidase I [Blochmannia endosymbiont of Camponotus sp.]
MISTFSLVLVIITGISGIFWGIKQLYIIICNHNQHKKIFLQKSNNIYQQSKNTYSLIISYCSKISEFVSSLFPILLLVFIIRSFIFEPFRIPSGSMMPTLLIGDFILVKKFIYGIKNPVTQKTLINTGHPKRGDVIVFKYPKNPTLNYIKRVIGEPGDKIIYNIITKQLTIYPNYINHIKYIQQPLPITYNNISPSNFIQIFSSDANGKVNSSFIKIKSQKKNPHGIRLIQTTESFNGIEHNILTMIPPGDQNLTKMYDQHTKHLVSEWLVPTDEYFVMGDNRDNSADSRYWGFVPERNIVGKAIIIWMNIKKREEGIWPISIQMNRIGKIQ